VVRIIPCAYATRAVRCQELEYLASVAGHAHEVFTRAIEHLNRTGASHELYGPIKRAMLAVGAIGVHVHYIKCDAARRARDAGEHMRAHDAGVSEPSKPYE
jgi:hypothetical protein